MRDAAERLVREFPAPVLLAALIQALPEADSQLQGALGLVAQRLPAPLTEERLLQQALNKSLPAEARFSAVTLLQDYLQRPVDPAFVQDIADVDSVVLSSMQDAFAARERFPGVLIEYTDQFSSLETGHRAYVLDLLRHVNPADAAELLRTMAHSANREVGRQALDALSRLEGRAAVETAYILSQSLYLDPELSGMARGQLRRRRLAGNRFVPPTAPHAALARFLGLDAEGTAHWYLAHDALPFGLLVGYGFRQGVRRLQQIPHGSDMGSWQDARRQYPEVRYDWARWHISDTLSRFPPLDPQAVYLDTYQVLGPELWRWEPPVEGAEALATMRRAFTVQPSELEPEPLAASLASLPYGKTLAGQWQDDSGHSEEEHAARCAWLFSLTALAQWHVDRSAAGLLAHAAARLEEEAPADEFVTALQRRWGKKTD